MRAEALLACRACGGELSEPILDLGEQPLANGFLAAGADMDAEPRIALRAVRCRDCQLLQLDRVADAAAIFGDYAYLSSVSSTWLDHARVFCERQIARQGLGDSSFVLEVASNDGYLLKNFVARGIKCLGVEPAGNVAQRAIAVGVPTLCAFFGRRTASQIVAAHGRADLVVANNVLAHVPDVVDFIAGLALCVKPEGLISIEFPHVLRMIEGLQFDTVYHEHFSYWSLRAAEPALAAAGLEAVDVDQLPTHGGSLRLFAAPRGARVASAAIAALRELEAARLTPATLEAFAGRVQACLNDFRAYLARARQSGFTLAAYGAAAKGNTFLNAVGDAARDIVAVADANPLKIGARLPGSHIPVLSPADVIALRPDAILILPWNLMEEISRTLRSLGFRGAILRAIPELEEMGELK